MTAVEWLINQLIFKEEYEHLPNNYFLMSDKDIDNIIKQAKQMEKEQMDTKCNQQEISDEKIEKEIHKIYGRDCEDFYSGAIWYREQLRSISNKSALS